MIWTDEQVERLKQLWLEGLSASQVAKRLGGVTRNSVIGKVYRLGLSRKTLASRTDEASQSEVGVALEASRLSSGSQGQNGVCGEDASRPQSGSATASNGHIDLLNLNERTCRWPIGEPCKPGFCFCGKTPKPGSPYCEYHTGIAYQPVQIQPRHKQRPGQRKTAQA